MADRYFRQDEHGTLNVIYIPDDWPIDDDGDYLGYGAANLVSNDSEVRTLWFCPSLLKDEINEKEARTIHPALFAYLSTL